MEIGKAESSGRVPYQGSAATPSVTPVRPETKAVPEASPQPAAQMQSTPQPVMTQNVVQTTVQNQQGSRGATQGAPQEKRTAEKEEKRTGQGSQLKNAVNEMNRQMKESEAIFGIHEKTNRVTIKIVDKATKEVIKEYPPEQTLDMIAKVWEVAGILVDEKM